MGSGCGCLIADFSFVCQTTPHFGSTSRKASYSVRGYHTPNFAICKAPIVQSLSNIPFPHRTNVGANCVRPRAVKDRPYTLYRSCP